METDQEVRGREPLLLRIHPDSTHPTNLGRTTIYHEIASGRLRAVRIGRAVRVRRDDLEAWLDHHSTHHGNAQGASADRSDGGPL